METPQPIWATCATLRERVRFLLEKRNETKWNLLYTFVLSCHWVPLRLFSSLVPQFSSLGLSSHPEMLQFLNDAHDSLCFNTSMPLLDWEAQNWAQRYRGITDRRVTSLHLQATPCLIQLRKLLAFSAARAHYELMVNLVFPRTPGPGGSWAPLQPENSHHVLISGIIDLAK